MSRLRSLLSSTLSQTTAWFVVALLCLCAPVVSAQPRYASNGSDGSLVPNGGTTVTINTSAGTIIFFDGSWRTVYGRLASNGSGTSIYLFDFTTIYIASTVAVSVSGSRPLGLLATTGVTINANISLNGGNGAVNPGSSGGAGGGAGALGGYAGGPGGRVEGFLFYTVYSGSRGWAPSGTVGYGGSSDPYYGGGGGAYGGNGGPHGSQAPGGYAYGNTTMSTLYGGSGGAGGGGAASLSCTFFGFGFGGSGGGGGGGAIYISTISGTLTINGTISANGGNGGTGGG